MKSKVLFCKKSVFGYQVMEHERRLNTALLQSGKFKEALQALLKWLGETEELVANQKPPSAEYKVARAQMQEQKVRVWQRRKKLFVY